jgi:hypothetical protein
MKHIFLINPSLTAVIVLLISACNNTTPSTNDSPSPTLTPSIATTESVQKDKTESHGGQGGQVVETGAYHLELLTLKESNGFHLDFYLQKGTDHTSISNAVVKGTVQVPDGTQKNLDFKYSDKDQHYTALLFTQVPGDYKIAILSNLNGEKINGRFNFRY